MESALLRKATEGALSKAWSDLKGVGIFRPEPLGYVRQPENNLVEGVTLDLFSADLDQGAGSELKPHNGEPPKFCAAYSSSALVANTFAFFKPKRRQKLLTLFGGNFSQLRLEGRAPTGLDGTPPNLDVLITGTQAVVGIESKCTEYFSEKKAEFSASYDRIKDLFEKESWLVVYEALKTKPLLFGHLDAAQLVKHYLGLRNTYRREKKTLLYLYWEPKNAAQFPIFLAHIRNIQEFKDRVAGSEVDFQAQSYLELWRNWEKATQNQELLLHVQNLKRRYCLALPS